MDVRKLGFGLAMALLLAVPAGAKPLPRHGVFVYSDLCIEPESDDWAGHRLVVVLLEGDTLVNYEWSEGGLEGAAADYPASTIRRKGWSSGFPLRLQMVQRNRPFAVLSMRKSSCKRKG